MRRRTTLMVWVALAVTGAVAACVAAFVLLGRGDDGTTVTPVDAGAATRLAQQPAPTPTPSATPIPTVSTPASPSSVPAPAVAAAPVRLKIGAIDIAAPVVPVGVDRQGDVAIPRAVDTVGWYRFGVAPGAPEGSAVLVGHVDDRNQGEGTFFRLREVGRGDTVTVRNASGRTLTYRVVSREQFPKPDVPLDDLFSRTGVPRLTLITCGGSFDQTRRSYRDNIVVTAVRT